MGKLTDSTQEFFTDHVELQIVEDRRNAERRAEAVTVRIPFIAMRAIFDTDPEGVWSALRR